VVVILATPIAGMAPAVMSARFSLSETLNEGGRGGGLGTGSHRLRRLLVGAEMAWPSRL